MIAASPPHDDDLVEAAMAATRTACPRLHARLAALDPEQRAAVVADESATVVHAHVGSGKTTVLIHRAIYLHRVAGIPLDDIALVTFTNRAADQLIARLEDLVGRALAPIERRRIGTFHGVAHALLHDTLPVERIGHRPGFTVLDADARDALYLELARRHRLRLGSRRDLHARAQRAAAGADPHAAALAELAARVRDEKRARNAMDFDDLLDHATALLAEADAPTPPRALLVDELQDCEARELALLARLRGPATTFFGVGDPLQSIYGWRGGSPATMARLEASLGARRRTLPRSYRSTRTILDAARAVLGLQPDGAGAGALHAARPDGAPVQIHRHHDPLTEATYLADRIGALIASGVMPRDIAVLCRLRAQVEALAPHLASHGVPCDANADATDAGAEDAVRVLTLHAAKGLEFRHVFVSGANLGIVPLALHDDPADPAEERRLFYVALTRARDEVEISYQAHPHTFGAFGMPSPLLRQLPALVHSHPTAAAAPPLVAAGAPARATAPPPQPPAIAPAPAVAAAWTIGQAVRHPRYGTGVVIEIAADTVRCQFGKLGAHAFPRRLCPLSRAEPS